MRPLSRIEIRNVDSLAIHQYGIPGVVLMENAGRNCADVIDRHWAVGNVVVCCGKGNNGGDGFVIARYLENSGWKVKVRLAYAPERSVGDAALFLASIEKSGIDIRCVSPGPDTTPPGGKFVSWGEFVSDLGAADLIVDALLGTGLTGEVRSPDAELIEAINAAQRTVLAVDLPSGLDCNTGQPLGCCVRATRTVTMVAEKLGFENSHSQALTGPVDVVGIGLPLALVRILEVQAR